MSDDKQFHDRIGGQIQKAIALRVLSRYRGALDDAKFYGADVSDLPTPPSFAALAASYEAIIDDWLPETPDTISAIRAFLDLAIAIVTDRHFYMMFSNGLNFSEEKDGLHLMMALAALDGWVNKIDTDKLVTNERARLAGEKGEAR
ncbi:MAG TPA: hypothetical protein VJ770_09305 [Stellaceae bacterium]|nr:hypothetical protein [Stellaceae bacterium]